MNCNPIAIYQRVQTLWGRLKRLYLVTLLCVIPACGELSAQPSDISTIRVTFGELVLGSMPLVADLSQVKAGQVEFVIRNQSRKQMHSVFIAQLDDKGQGLLTKSFGSTVDMTKSKLKYVAKFATVIPLQTVRLSVDLGPGNYVIFCSQKGHYSKEGDAKFIVVK